MKKSTLLSFGTAVISAAIVSFVAYGCGDDDSGVTSKPDSGTTSSSGGSSGGSSGTDAPSNPPKPTLGAQIDRMGRPGVNTALQQTFTPDGTRGPAQDEYNKDGNKAGWVAKYTPNFAGSLAIYDGVDTTCGNQAFASADAGADGAVEKYGALAGVLANDVLWLDTSKTCAANQYLAVELNALGVAQTDCGGRTLPNDVIKTTYTALASTLSGPVDDTINAVPSKTSGTTFPYLAAPQ